ncbi:MAG: hypothetical protein WC620_05440 [Methanoregula sp.]
MTLIKKDYRDLAAAYRDIAVSASLPGDGRYRKGDIDLFGIYLRQDR